MNMAEYCSRRSQQSENFEPIIRGLKVIFFTETKCKIRFIWFHGQPKCFWPFWTLLGPSGSGPFWTISDKNDFSPKWTKLGLAKVLRNKKSIFCLKWSKRVPNGQKHLG